MWERFSKQTASISRTITITFAKERGFEPHKLNQSMVVSFATEVVQKSISLISTLSATEFFTPTIVRLHHIHAYMHYILRSPQNGKAEVVATTV